MFILAAQVRPSKAKHHLTYSYMATMMTNSSPLILASTSPRRAELLGQLGVNFKAISSDIAEIHHGELTAREICQVNAYRKARAVAKKHPDAMVLGADTLVYIDTKVYGKPATLEKAYLMLEELQGRTHRVTTAVCLLHLRSHRQRILTDDTAVTFQPLTSSKIRRYLSAVDPLDKAGGYAIQEHGGDIVESTSGSYTNVVGLPLEKLAIELQTWAGIPAFFTGHAGLMATKAAMGAGSRRFAQ